MTNKETNLNKRIIPNLRFPEFCEEWRKYKLSELAKRIIRKNKENNLNILTISSQLGLISQLEFFNKSVSAKDVTGYYLLHRNDFAYNKSYSTGYPMGAIKRLNRYEKGVVSTLYICFNFNNNIDNAFIEQSFETGNQNTEIEKIAQEGARNHGLLNIGVSDFFNISLNIPSLQEQQKIASFLTLINERIECQRKIINQHETEMRIIREKIFNQQIRFKDENGNYFTDWIYQRLGKMSHITTGRLDANAMIENGDYRFYTCAKDFYKIDKYAFDTEALLISGNGANVGYIHYYKGRFNAYQRTYVLDDFRENILYVKYFLDTYLEKRINLEKKEGNTPYIVLSTLSEMEIKIPCIKEQTKIANFLSSLDAKIETEKQLFEQYKQQKAYLLQNLFI